MVVWKPKCVCFNNNKIEGNEELMLVILNCSLLHNQNDHESLVTTNTRRVTSQKNEDFKTHLGVNVKLPIFLPDFNQIWNFQDTFSQAYPVSNFKEIRPVGAALIHADRQTWQRRQALVATRQTRLKTLTFSPQHTWVFQTILTTKSDYFPTQYWSLQHKQCSPWERNSTFIHYNTAYCYEYFVLSFILTLLLSEAQVAKPGKLNP